MELTYRKASIEDLEELTRTRVEVLRAANRLTPDADMSEVERQSERYYRTALADGTHTAPEYRRQGIALETLRLLVEEIRSRGISAISLEATEMGHPLYERFGFAAMKDEMELPEEENESWRSAKA